MDIHMDVNDYLENVMPIFKDYETVKAHLLAKCMPIAKVREGVDVCKTVGDVAAVAYLLVELDDNQAISARLSTQFVTEVWGKEPADILEEAITNTVNVDKPVLIGLDDGTGYVYQCDLDSPDLTISETFDAYVCVSTEHHAFGATMAFIPVVLDKVCTLCNTQELYIAFTSECEIMAHPAEPCALTVEEIRSALVFTDEECGHASLSCEVFRYRLGGELTVVQ